MSSLKLRSFTVPNGSRFVCTPLDGQGPFLAESGEQVVIVARETWDKALAEAMSEMMKVAK